MVGSGVSAMANPFEFRELMAASVGYDQRSVEQVQAEHERRHQQTAASRKSAGTGRRPKAPVGPPPVTNPAAIPAGTMDALRELRTHAKVAE